MATTTVYASGNQDVDGLLTGIRWYTPVTSPPNPDGSDPDLPLNPQGATLLTFSFPTNPSQIWYGGERDNNFEALNGTQKAAVYDILGMYAAVANLRFTEASNGVLRFAMSDTPGTAVGNYPSTDEQGRGGDMWFNNSSGRYDGPIRGNDAYRGFMHELGHALGLKHGHESWGYGALPGARDSMEYSVMTYRSYVGDPLEGGYSNGPWSHPQTLMMNDIAALQYMYGANFNTNSGNTTYSWSPATGEMFVNGVGQGAPGENKIFMTVWDGGGTDTYDFSGYATSLSVNLNPGQWTTVSVRQLADLGDSHVAAGNIANALLHQGNPASLIENARGGSANDRIVGNQANNTLWGNDGDDLLDGGVGADVMNGGNGDDTYYVDNPGDIVSEFALISLRGPTFHSGTDTVVTTLASYTLGPAIENLIYTGTASFIGNGDALANLIIGGSARDTLSGGGGADRLSGGLGNDTLYGGSANDTLDGDQGSDRLVGEAGSDTFVFSAFENAVRSSDTIDGFAAGGTEDVIQLEDFGRAFDTFAEVQAVARYVGLTNSTIIQFDGDTSIALVGVTPAQLTAADFLFV